MSFKSLSLARVIKRLQRTFSTGASRLGRYLPVKRPHCMVSSINDGGKRDLRSTEAARSLSFNWSTQVANGPFEVIGMN